MSCGIQSTLLLGNGVDVKTVQTRLGHASPNITISIYAHAISENDRKAGDLIADLFSGKATVHNTAVAESHGQQGSFSEGDQILGRMSAGVRRAPPAT